MAVLSTPGGFWQKTVELLMHLIPTGVVLVALVISWRREWVGAVVFPLLALFQIVTKWGRLHWSGYALIAGPLFLLGVLFFLNWRNRATLRASPR